MHFPLPLSAFLLFFTFFFFSFLAPTLFPAFLPFFLPPFLFGFGFFMLQCVEQQSWLFLHALPFLLHPTDGAFGFFVLFFPFDLVFLALPFVSFGIFFRAWTNERPFPFLTDLYFLSAFLPLPGFDFFFWVFFFDCWPFPLVFFSNLFAAHFPLAQFNEQQSSGFLQGLPIGGPHCCGRGQSEQILLLQSVFSKQGWPFSRGISAA